MTCLLQLSPPGIYVKDVGGTLPADSFGRGVKENQPSVPFADG